ncbi:hypothetical protein [Pyrococcus kukulkanii]|uniref:hypothetical protein n=1 Tax=Pyrococcus kukulkanii TaxID=1609559 RepID=UPI003565C2ED
MKEAKEFLLEIADEGLFISVITLSELLSGKETRDPVKKGKAPQIFEEALSDTPH